MRRTSGNLTFGVQTFQLVENVGTHRSHTRTAADKYHFGIGVFGEKFAERAGNRNFVAGFERPDVGRHLSRRRIRYARGRRGDTHVQHNDAFFFRIRSDRVGTQNRLVHFGNVLPQIVFVPVFVVFLWNVEVFVGNGVRRGFNLDEPSARKGTSSPSGMASLSSLMNVALLSLEMTVHSIFHAEHFFGDFDVHVGFDVDLARQTAAFACFAFADVGQLGRQDVAAAALRRRGIVRTNRLRRRRRG